MVDVKRGGWGGVTWIGFIRNFQGENAYKELIDFFTITVRSEYRPR